MQINVSYDSSVDDAPAAFKIDVQYAVNLLDAAFSNNVTLNIHVAWGEVGGAALQTGDLGESETAVAPKYTYSQIVGVAFRPPACRPLTPRRTLRTTRG
jgi:nucleoside-diphosphate-sugar epimerase